MAHVGVERLAPRYRQKHGAEHGDPSKAVRFEIAKRVNRVESPNHTWIARYPNHTERGNGDEPDDDDRAEDATDAMCTVLLEYEQRDKDDNRYWYHVRLEERCGN